MIEAIISILLILLVFIGVIQKRSNDTEHSKGGTITLIENVREIYPDLTESQPFYFLENIRRELLPQKGKFTDADYLKYMQDKITDVQSTNMKNLRDRILAPQEKGPVNLMPILHYPSTGYRPWKEEIFDEPITIGKFKIHVHDDRWILATLVDPITDQPMSSEQTQNWFADTYERFRAHLHPEVQPNQAAAVHVSIIRIRHLPTNMTIEDAKAFIKNHAPDPFTVRARGIATGFSFIFTEFDWFNALLVDDDSSESTIRIFENALTNAYPETKKWVTQPGKHHITVATHPRPHEITD